MSIRLTIRQATQLRVEKTISSIIVNTLSPMSRGIIEDNNTKKAHYVAANQSVILIDYAAELNENGLTPAGEVRVGIGDKAALFSVPFFNDVGGVDPATINAELIDGFMVWDWYNSTKRKTLLVSDDCYFFTSMLTKL